MAEGIVGGRRYQPPPAKVPWLKMVPFPTSWEIIGIQSPDLIHRTTTCGTGAGELTETTFDTTTRADSARILLTNSTGSEKTITDASIRGKLIFRLQGANGYLHDKFVNYDSIYRDGEELFELGNPFIVTLTQVNKLADWHWKRNKTKKHIYTISMIGFQSFFEPGEWYTLQVGGAGQEENLDSIVECYSVRCTLGDGMYTQVSFREVEENWKFDSNEVARFIASGGFDRAPQGRVVTVASQYYTGYADYYCDGTQDQIELNNAITYVSQAYNGGTVQLFNGVYNVTGTISMLSGIALKGQGPGTIINRASASSFTVLEASGSAASYISNISVSDIKFTGTKNDDGRHISWNYTDQYAIYNTTITTPLPYSIFSGNGHSGVIANNIIDGTNATSLKDIIAIGYQSITTSYGIIIQSNIVNNMQTSVNIIGIKVDDNVQGGGIMVTNNTIYNLKVTTTSKTCEGIKIQDSIDTIVSSNRISLVKAASALAIAIHITTAASNVLLTNNFAYNNGLDTGIANTNLNNLLDNGANTQIG